MSQMWEMDPEAEGGDITYEDPTVGGTDIPIDDTGDPGE
jgi:hypothetical protein